MSKVIPCENCSVTLCETCNKKYQEATFNDWIEDISTKDIVESCSIDEDCENCGS